MHRTVRTHAALAQRPCVATRCPSRMSPRRHLPVVQCESATLRLRPCRRWHSDRGVHCWRPVCDRSLVLTACALRTGDGCSLSSHHRLIRQCAASPGVLRLPDRLLYRVRCVCSSSVKTKWSHLEMVGNSNRDSEFPARKSPIHCERRASKIFEYLPGTVDLVDQDLRT